MAYKRLEIHVGYADVEQVYVQEVLAGIEEEGFCSHCYPIIHKQPISGAYEAAKTSLLGVGIGMVGQEVVLHVHDLQEDTPLIHVKTKDAVVLRMLGSNAARYIKGIPFKAFHKCAEERIDS